MNLKSRNEGSSLVIALFFFLLCSLLCAGMLYLAGSSMRGVSKSVEIAQSQIPPNPNDIPTPTPLPPTTLTPTPNPEFQAEVAAIDLVYDTLYYDFHNAFVAAEAGGEYYVYKKSNPNLSYAVLSYIHAYYNNNKSTADYPDQMVYVDASGDMIAKTFIVTANGIDVKVVIDMDGTNGSKANGNLSKNQNWGLEFQTFKITVSAVDGSECGYKRTFEYTVPDNNKFYIRWVEKGDNGKDDYRFVIKSSV